LRGEKRKNKKKLSFPQNYKAKKISFLMAKKKGKKQEEFSFPD